VSDQRLLTDAWVYVCSEVVHGQQLLPMQTQLQLQLQSSTKEHAHADRSGHEGAFPASKVHV
jgi:hypothetical protein